MESRVVQSEILAGSFVALVVLLGAVSASERSRDKGLLDAHRIHLPRGSGLQKGAPVLMRGIEVGSIGDVELTTDRTVRVTAEIAPRFARLLEELRESVEDLREQAPINSFSGVVFSAF